MPHREADCGDRRWETWVKRAHGASIGGGGLVFIYCAGFGLFALSYGFVLQGAVVLALVPAGLIQLLLGVLAGLRSDADLAETTRSLGLLLLVSMVGCAACTGGAVTMLTSVAAVPWMKGLTLDFAPVSSLSLIPVAINHRAWRLAASATAEQMEPVTD